MKNPVRYLPALLALPFALLACGNIHAPETIARSDTLTTLESCDPGKAVLESAGLAAKPVFLSPPEKGRWFRDPAHGSCMIRVTDHEHEPPEGFARNDYSRRQPFNADGTRLLVYARNGYWHLYDASTFAHEKRLNLGGGSTEPHWHPDDPDLLFVLPNNGGMQLMTYNVENGQRSVVADFNEPMPVAGRSEPARLRDIWPLAARAWTRSEGSPSMDARYWAFQVETKDFQPLGLISYDMKNNRITGVYDFRKDGNGIGRPDHVSMSPKGNYVVASWNGRNVDCESRRHPGTRDAPCGLMAYSRDFTRATGLASRGPHSDMAVAANGEEVIVISNYVSGDVEMIALDDGDVTKLWRIYEHGNGTAMHVSGKAYRKPGWVLISTYAERSRNGTTPWYANRIMAVELRRDPRIINLGSTFNAGTGYFSEPHAVVDRDFRRVVFNSNWGSGRDEDIDVYLLDIPAAAFPEAARNARRNHAADAALSSRIHPAP